MTQGRLLLAAGGVAALTAAGWMASARRLRARTAQLAQAEWRAEYDGLTGLLRRDGFERRAAAALSSSNAAGLLDLNEFKPINDRYGHAVGDEVLREVAARLVDELGGDALIARLGGDEFAWIARLEFPAVHRQLEHLVDVLTAPIVTAGAGAVAVGVSLGVVWLGDLPTWNHAEPHGPTGDRSADLLTEALSHADIAMYEAKALRHGWQLYDRHLDPIRPASRICPVPQRRYRDHGPAALPATHDSTERGGGRRWIR